MRKILLTTVIVCCNLFLYAQFNLSGCVENLPKGETLTINIPFTFGYLESGNQPLAVNKDGSFAISLPLDKEKIGYLRWGNHQAFLWMKPGSSLFVALDGTTGGIAFAGSTASNNRLLHELKLNDAPRFYREDKRVDANEMQDSVIRPYTVHLVAKTAKIDSSQLNAREKEFLKTELHYHFLVYLDLYVRTANWSTNVWNTFILDAMKEEKPKSQSYLRGPMYDAFIDTYLGFLETRAFANRDDPARFTALLDSIYGIGSLDSLTTVYENKGKAYMNWLVVKRAFDAATSEEYLAKQIQAIYEEGHLSEADRLLDVFRSSFHNSNYLDTLTSKRTMLIERMEKPNDQIVIPADYRTFSSIKTFIQQFKGKVVYLDIWGTWCGPCKIELRYVPQLKERFKEKGVVFVYLDMDDDNKDARWREYIQANGITGVHLRKDPADIQPIWNELLPNDKNLHGRYPSFFLFDKNGNLVNGFIKRPSEKEALYSQLENYLRSQ